MSKIGRNDPCPCGSGKKYKHCHLGKEAPSGSSNPVAADDPGAGAAWRDRIPWILAAIGGAAGVFFWVDQGLQPAISIWAGTGLFAGGWALFNNPPPSNPNSGDPAGLNFGRKD